MGGGGQVGAGRRGHTGDHGHVVRVEFCKILPENVQSGIFPFYGINTFGVERHFHGDAAGAGSHVPDQTVAAQGQLGKADGPDLAFGHRYGVGPQKCLVREALGGGKDAGMLQKGHGQGIKNGMSAVNVHTLVEAAEMLGCSRIYAFFKVVVPNLISSVVVSSLLAVGIIFGDYVLVRNLTGTSFQNMQIYLYQTMKSDSMKASAVFVVIMAITFIIAAVTLHLKNRGRKAVR